MRPDAAFRCANLVYGMYDLAGTPSMLHFDRRLVFHRDELAWFAQNLVPDEARRRSRSGDAAPSRRTTRDFSSR